MVVFSAKTYPGVDVGSDHNPVVAQIQIRLKEIVRISIESLT